MHFEKLLFQALYREAFPPFSRELLEEVAARAPARFIHPRAVALMDGKHINSKVKTDYSTRGSDKYSYKL